MTATSGHRLWALHAPDTAFGNPLELYRITINDENKDSYPNCVSISLYIVQLRRNTEHAHMAIIYLAP